MTSLRPLSIDLGAENNKEFTSCTSCSKYPPVCPVKLVKCNHIMCYYCYKENSTVSTDYKCLKCKSDSSDYTFNII